MAEWYSGRIDQCHQRSRADAGHCQQCAIATSDPSTRGWWIWHDSVRAIPVTPVGYLKANGAAIPVASYTELAASLYVGDGSNAAALFGYKCTDPLSPSTTRNIAGTHIVLPDLRGEFIRAWDDARGIDVGRTLGSWQVDEFKLHDHTFDAMLFNGGSYAAFSNISGPSTGTTSAVGGSETRPRNIALLACIKY